MASRFKIEFQTKALLRKLRAARRRSKNQKPAWNKAGNLMLKSVDATFAAEGRPHRWVPWAPSTAARRAALFGGKILNEFGSMEASIGYAAGPTYVDVGTQGIVYAATHQVGREPVPARPFLVVQTEDEIAIANLIADFITEPLRR